MCGEHQRFWWPLELSACERDAVTEVSLLLQSYPAVHDRALAKRASTTLASAMRSSIVDIDDRDTLPNLCHVVNGWGDAPLPHGSVLDGYARYVHRSDRGEPHILQCAAEGDFHPWQSFAYAVMAGIPPQTRIAGADCTLLELAVGSRSLNTKDGCELGHLLYTAAHLGLERDTTFVMVDEVVTLEQLVDLAIDAHHDGHFRVCRKVHLTEGLCAMAGLDPAFAEHREVAQGFLDGQLDLLPVLCAAVLGARRARERGEAVAEGSQVSALRQSLVVESFIENHYYLAGHLIELATLAHGFGYRVGSLHWAAARFLTDELNRLLPVYLPQVFFPACFLHFGHYRRAVTLLEELADGGTLDPASRARFTADFRRVEPARPRGLPAADDGVFRIGPSDPPMRTGFADTVHAYRAIAHPMLTPRGNGAHFRRVLVPGWPRSLHFEMFDYASRAIEDKYRSGIGVELHLEDPQQSSLFPALERVAAQLGASGGARPVELDPSWWGNAGRLRLWFDDGAAPEEIASSLRDLIEVAVPILGVALRRGHSLASSHAS